MLYLTAIGLTFVHEELGIYIEISLRGRAGRVIAQRTVVDSVLFAGRPQHLLENMYVDQSIELTSDFFERSYVKETHAGIEMQTFFAALGHSRDKGVES